ncbi:universal stress protein [Mycolicibacterium sp. 120270]|uniref:universal stress protein n=1 Tax=Mycolicibacterium sp. 120270 TaxID=3090600 RepID=UPI00299CE655|nr:universal stress protein [Mycolicibacterium sp. 120270]MDX1887897.1 universal stress protein [Mycolicibacterium sp. 120270]
MTIIVGYPPNRKGKAALNLGALLSRSSGEDLVVCTVAPPPWLPGVVREDLTYEQQINAMIRDALEQARTELPSDVSATFTTVKARSTSVGLLDAAEEHKASLIVVGSSAAGLFGRIQLSSVADRLLHSSPIPVGLAPRGFRVGDTDKVDCVTVAYTGTEESDSLLRTASALVEQLGSKMRLASFAVQPAPPVTALFRAEEADLVAEWTESIKASARRVLGDSAEPDAGVVIGRGHDWETALNDIPWHPGDLLVIGSSESGPIARVFLGSRAAKIIRHAPVPVIVVPRDAEK